MGATQECSRYLKFLGIGWVLLSICQGIFALAEPLIRLMKKDVKFVWDAYCEHAFEELKIRLTTAPVLTVPKSGEPYEVYTNTSG